jgi:hypothetical protein
MHLRRVIPPLKTFHQSKETMKTILTLIVVALGVTQTAARAVEEPAWSLEGRMISADSCGVDCPCIIGGPPHHGQCQFVALWQIDDGKYGDVKLAGTKIALAGEFALKVIGEPIKKTFVAYYIDSAASAGQREALRNLLTGPSFAGMGQPAEVKEAAIQFENLDAFGQVGKTASGTVGEVAKVEVTPIAGGTNPDKPMAVENEAEPGLKWTALGKTSNSFYRSAGKDYKFDGTSGESHRFAMKGGGEK